MKQRKSGALFSYLLAIFFVCFAFIPYPAQADEKLYDELRAAKGTGIYEALNAAARNIDWEEGEEKAFDGHLRLLRSEALDGKQTNLFMARSIEGELFVLADVDFPNLDKMLQDKLHFRITQASAVVGDTTYQFARLLEPPSHLAFDRIFKIAIVLMLFFVMLGMGLTLTLGDFKIVFIKPWGMFTGAFLQWVIMPLIAVAIGYLFGFYAAFPFVFVGIVLITISPGGVTSNLMTYYAKGDLALSISLTSFSTVLSVFLTPLLLAFYCSSIPDIEFPVGMVMQTIVVLVIIPLSIGMLIRARWENFSKKAVPLFSALGVIALLVLIGAGILGNLEKFADTERYGFLFYSTVGLLTGLGMFFGVIVSKLFRINNYQTRAISLETGLRNASLAMAIALLIQDYMGDFHSSMFFTSAIFGLLMYVAGFTAIKLYPSILPLDTEDKAKK